MSNGNNASTNLFKRINGRRGLNRQIFLVSLVAGYLHQGRNFSFAPEPVIMFGNLQPDGTRDEWELTAGGFVSETDFLKLYVKEPLPEYTKEELMEGIDPEHIAEGLTIDDVKLQEYFFVYNDWAYITSNSANNLLNSRGGKHKVFRLEGKPISASDLKDYIGDWDLAQFPTWDTLLRYETLIRRLGHTAERIGEIYE